MVVFANTGFMGYPVLLDVFGQEAVFYASLIHMAFNFFVYTYAIMCLTKGDDSEFKLNFKQLLTPGIILIFVGIFIYLFDMMLNETKATNNVNNTFCVNPATRYPIKQALATTKAYGI